MKKFKATLLALWMLPLHAIEKVINWHTLDVYSDGSEANLGDRKLYAAISLTISASMLAVLTTLVLVVIL